METRYFKTLVAAVESGSFSRAAEGLNITQSAVSQRIKFLEEHYGRQLLDRTAAALVPTEAGEVVLEKARDILRSEREIDEGLKRLGGRKRLSLCCTPTFGMAFLPRVLNQFLLKNSDVADLKFIFQQPEQALHSLNQGDFDLAVIEHCERLADELVFVSAKRNLPPRLSSIAPLLPFRLMARKDGCSSKELLRGNLARLGHHLEDFSGVVVTDDLRLTIETVAAGTGVAFVSTHLVASELAEGRLVAHRVEGFEHCRSRSVVLPQKRRVSDGANPLLEDLLRVIRQTVEDSSRDIGALDRSEPCF